MIRRRKKFSPPKGESGQNTCEGGQHEVWSLKRDCRKDNTNWKNFLESLKSHHLHFAEEIKSKLDLYTNFTIFSKELRSRLKSTNASENLHKEPEKIRINSGGYFQSEKILFAKWAIFIKNLHFKKWPRPDPFFKANLQSLHLLFQHTFQSYEIKNEKKIIYKTDTKLLKIDPHKQTLSFITITLLRHGSHHQIDICF